jgi:hypothetical protein
MRINFFNNLPKSAINLKSNLKSMKTQPNNKLMMLEEFMRLQRVRD